MAANYAFQQYDETSMARAYGRALSVSTKKAVETCKWVKGKSLSQARKMLEDVVALRRAVPYTRFNQELAHQRNTGSGGFPVTVCKEMLLLLKSAEANATAKGLNTEALTVEHACAHLASRPMRYGRQRRIKAKRTHLEIVLKEGVQKKDEPAKKADKKQPAKQASAKEAKPVEKKTEEKPAAAEEAKAENDTKESPSTKSSEESTKESKKDESAEKKDDAQ
ncbi:MAG: 50S ribosomal protein L22 [Nanoarchaeota archaeon]